MLRSGCFFIFTGMNKYQKVQDEVNRRVGVCKKTPVYTAKDIVEQVEELPLEDQVKALGKLCAKLKTGGEASDALASRLNTVVYDLVSELLDLKNQLECLQYDSEQNYKRRRPYRSGAFGDD